MKTAKPRRNWRVVPAKPKPVRPCDKRGCVLYARVSTGKQGEGIESQLARLQRRAADKGFVVHETIIADPERGNADDRPSLDKMLEYCRQHDSEIGYVLVTDFKRAARDNPKWSEVDKELRQHNIAVYSVDYDTSTETAQGRHFANQNVIQGELELEELRQKALGAKEVLRRRGCPSFSAPLGYENGRLDKITPTLVPDPGRADLLKELFEEAAKGSSISEILEKTFRSGLRTKRGCRLTRQTLMSILRNPVYAGFLTPGPDGGELVKGNWVPLIPEEEFDAVQRILDGVSRNSPRKRSPNPEFPLATVLCCPVCGTRFSGYCQKGHRYYRCRADSAHLHDSARRIESDLEVLLRRLEPCKRCSRDISPVFIERTRALAKEIRLVDGRMSQLNRTINEMTERVISSRGGTSELTVISRCREELSEVTTHRKRLEAAEMTAEEIRSRATQLYAHPEDAWRVSSGETRRKLLKRLFPNGLTYDPRCGFPRLDDEVTTIFRASTESEVERSEDRQRTRDQSHPQSSTAGSPRRIRRRRV